MAIPASQIVSVNSSVLAPGGTGLILAGMFLTQNPLVPTGPPTSFANVTAVLDYFGASSTEYAQAQVYFQGFDTSNIKPGLLWFAQYPTAPVAAFLRGGPAPTLAAIQTITPAVVNSGNGSVSGTTLTVGTITSGTILVGDLVVGTGVAAGSRIVKQLTGSPAGGVGTYQLSAVGTVSAATITAFQDLSVTIDGVVKTTASPVDLSTSISLSDAASKVATALALSGGQTCAYASSFNAFVITSGTTGVTSTITYGSGMLATTLALTQTTGAVLSQGADAVTSQSAFMATLLTYTSNWASFLTLWEPAIGIKEAFATWTAGTNGRFVYAAWDSDASIVGSPSAYAGFGSYLAANGLGGTAPVYNDINTASMISGMMASIDFTQLNGRVNFMFKTNNQVPGAVVTDLTAYENMIANGFSSYCAFDVQQDPDMLANGQISGRFKWIDSYVGALHLAVDIQAAMVSLLQQQKSIPYNDQGNGLIAQAAMDPINAALNFGTIRPNTTPSASEAAQMNAAAGIRIDDVVGNRGWYFQVLPASATVRAARQSPPVQLFYMDGQSVQQLVINAVDVL